MRLPLTFRIAVQHCCCTSGRVLHAKIKDKIIAKQK
jgi:hypothetical protein